MQRHLKDDSVWIFDLDNTLYPADCDLFALIDERMGAFICAHLGVGPVEARRVQKQYFKSHGTTLSGLMDLHGVRPEAFLDYVHDIDLGRIDRDPALDGLIGRLPGRKLIYTNGSAGHAERVMAKLGIGHHFEDVFDIKAANYLPKPQDAPFAALVARAGIAPEKAVMIDDMARNLRPAYALGMTTVWVDNGSEMGGDGADGDHIHHVIGDVRSWLRDLLGGPALDALSAG